MAPSFSAIIFDDTSGWSSMAVRAPVGRFEKSGTQCGRSRAGAHPRKLLRSHANCCEVILHIILFIGGTRALNTIKPPGAVGFNLVAIVLKQSSFCVAATDCGWGARPDGGDRGISLASFLEVLSGGGELELVLQTANP
jgi:hypothetical protein